MTDDPIADARAAAARGDFATAIDALRPLTEAGSSEAQFELGFLVLTECDLIPGREAFSLFSRAAEQGHAGAMYHLATFPQFLSEPFTSPLSDEEAWRWLLRAAESGSIEAQYTAGASLATGDWGEGSVPQDLEAAVGWYRRAAEAGSVEAQYNLASMLAEGEGCERDLIAALEWLRRAIAGGYEYGEEYLAHLESLNAVRYMVGIVVDPEFGDRISDLLARMPVWVAGTAMNRAAVTRAERAGGVDHTGIGAVTTFTVDPTGTPESWCREILDTVAGHHDRYSHSPGYCALEIYGAELSAALRCALAELRLTDIAAVPGGFRASTSDGQPAGSPNDS